MNTSTLRLAAVTAVLAASFACDDGAAPPAASPAHPVAGDAAPPPAKGPAILPGQVTKPGEPPVAMTRDEGAGLTDGGPIVDGCMTAELHCGDVVKGHTRGGAQKLDTRFYEKSFCTPATTQHDGGDERIYKLVVTEPQTRVLAYLDTPSADLDIAAFRETSGSTCPDPAGNIPRCEMMVKAGARKFVDIRDNDPTTYWIVVEGKGDAEGPFGLSIQCEKW